MVYGVVLAGGVGSRMGGDKPKQYLTVKDKPIIIYTIEKFISVPQLEKILVLCPSKWVEHTKNLIAKHIAPAADRVAVIEGGSTRNETIMNAIRYIENEGNLNDDTIIVTHDSVRPFVTYRIIEENIAAAEQFGAYLQDVKFSSTFKVPLYSNYTGYPYDRDCRELLQQQICNPVRWQTLVENMIADGADTFIELGPGQVLGGLIGRIDKSVTIYHVEDYDSLVKTVKEVRPYD